MHSIGQLVGAGIGSGLKSIGLLNVYVALAVVHVVFMLITVVAVKEDIPMSDNGKPDELRGNFGKVGDMNYEEDQGCCSKVTSFALDVIRPFKSNDFRWVYITRWLIQMGIYSVQEYIQYFVKDVISINWKSNMTVTTMTSLLCIIVIGGGSCGFVCGILSINMIKKNICVFFWRFYLVRYNHVVVEC